MKLFVENGKSLPAPIEIDVGIPLRTNAEIRPLKADPFYVKMGIKLRIEFWLIRKYRVIKKIIKFYFHKPKSSLKTKYEFFQKLGGKCIQCGFSDLRALQIDHVNSDGSSDRGTGKKYWKKVLKSIQENEGKYQLLCANCNWIKRETHGEIRKLKL